MNRKKLIFLLPGLLLVNFSFSQVNFLGKPGYISTPSASWQEERQLGITFSHLPGDYSVFKPAREENKVNLYSVRAGFTSFMEVNLSIAYRPLLAERIGVGDRQLDFRFRLFKETENRPAIVLGWTPPGSVSPVLAHDYLVATKNLETQIGKFNFSLGWGSPYLFFIDKEKDGFFNSLQVVKKSELSEKKPRFNQNDYLDGFFGGFSYMPVDFGGLTFEYDTATFNAGVFIKAWEWLYLQAYTFEGKAWAYTFSTQFKLDFSPKALRQYEKNLD
ncbi:YjbH domain-containing protein [Autumnicola edwardsiae]|uniref:YjbH domain-containing protein n=1 Tax=Autumnicola edwardsiae TaxID=3075594 RepID=A0ABU3CVE3_9FLAO|nr:YjbH domain-containing protein [Zunongwangia sp. F297]MDT0650325.1 YjbH domain-containing protein [Zunongwangia sp. F297]